MSAAQPFHLGWFMDGSSAQGWGVPWSGNVAQEWSTGQFHVDVARTLERAKFDFILWADAYYVPSQWQGMRDLYVERAVGAPRLDSMALSTFVAQATQNIGLVSTMATFAYHPYLLARMTGTLDSLSQGRAAWNVVTGITEEAYQNFGLDTLERHDDRYDRAMEYVELVKKIWDSWGPDSLVLNEDSGVFADPSKVHPVEYQGQFFQHSGGPLISGPSPQGRPVIAQAGASDKGKLLAGTHAEIIVGVGGSVEEMKKYREDVHAVMRAAGRNTDECKILFLISPTIGYTEEEAEARANATKHLAEQHFLSELADVGKRMNIDLSLLPLDEPLGEEHLALTTEAQVKYLERFIQRAKGKTLRELGKEYYQSSSPFRIKGSLDAVASQLEEVMAEVGGDGFLITEHSGAQTRRYVTEIADGLVPVLQRRGLVRREYEHNTLRENLQEF